MVRFYYVTWFIEEASKKHPFPNPCSYRTALTHYVDITSRPRTHVLKDLAEYCADESDKQKMLLMASSSEEGKVSLVIFRESMYPTAIHKTSAVIL